MFGYWRLGGSRAGHGKQCPDPQDLGKRLTAEEREKVFFKDDAGKLWYNPGNHFGNYFEPLRLDGFAKMYMDAVKAYFDSDGKANPWGLGWLQNNTYVNFGVWSKAMKGRPVSMAYLYNAGGYTMPFAQQYLGRVPKILGNLLSRDGYFFDGRCRWRRRKPATRSPLRRRRTSRSLR